MLDGVDTVLNNALASVENANDMKSLDAVRVQYLGKKGELTGLLKQLGSLSQEERPKAGEMVNRAKEKLQAVLNEKKAQLESKQLQAKILKETL